MNSMLSAKLQPPVTGTVHHNYCPLTSDITSSCTCSDQRKVAITKVHYLTSFGTIGRYSGFSNNVTIFNETFQLEILV